MPPRILQLVPGMFPSAHAEDLVQFFQSKGLGFWDEQQNQEPTDKTPGSVPSECTLRLEG